jgi:hypothetical protein
VNTWPCRLIRGGVDLGVLTHDPYEDAGPCEVGRLEPPLVDKELRALLLREFALAQNLIDIPSGSAEAALIQAEMELIQAAILRPGMTMIRLDDGETYQVIEFHMDGDKVFWR